MSKCCSHIKPEGVLDEAVRVREVGLGAAEPLRQPCDTIARMATSARDFAA